MREEIIKANEEVKSCLSIDERRIIEIGYEKNYLPIKPYWICLISTEYYSDSTQLRQT